MIERIKQTLNITFRNEALLFSAFTHTSFVNEKKATTFQHNERLEFLGDAVIELAVSDYLFRNFSQWSEGQLTRFRAQLVCEQTLSTLAKECGFDALLRLGRGEEANGGRRRLSLLCDVFESFVGALYLDQGMVVAQQFVLSQLVPKMQHVNLFVDYKTLLQEYLQQNGNVMIQYAIVFEDGPAHNKTFEATVSLNGTIIGRGSGKTKKAAQQEAAKQAYERKGELLECI